MGKINQATQGHVIILGYFDAVEKAIDRCIQEDQLKGYLLKKKAEVGVMPLTEFNQEAFAKAVREEG